MKTKNLLYTLVPLALTLTFAQVSQAYEENFIGYDQIVDELAQSRASISSSDYDAFSNVKIHTGAGVATSMLSIKAPKDGANSVFLKGIQVSLGIDLFSPNWVAEGTMRSYGEEQVDNTYISLKEFDLRFLYQDYFTSRLRFRAGAGMAARYMDYNYSIQATDAGGSPIDGETELVQTTHTTPSSVFSMALDAYLTRGFSIGAEVALRSSLIEDTIDRSSVDAGIRFDAHF